MQMSALTQATTVTVWDAAGFDVKDIADTGDWTHLVVTADGSSFSITGRRANVRALVVELAAACGLVVSDGERERVDHELACGSATVDVVWP